MSALFKLLRVLTTALAFALLAVYPHVPGLVRTAGASSVLLTIPFELPDRGGSAYVTLLEGDTVESSVDRFFQARHMFALSLFCLVSSRGERCSR